MMPKNHRVTIRLDDASYEKLKQAEAMGYTYTQYIEACLMNHSTENNLPLREILPHFCALQSELELDEDVESRRAMRKELHEICRVLKSSMKLI